MGGKGWITPGQLRTERAAKQTKRMMPPWGRLLEGLALFVGEYQRFQGWEDVVSVAPDAGLPNIGTDHQPHPLQSLGE
jgi:hypothetical protein